MPHFRGLFEEKEFFWTVPQAVQPAASVAPKVRPEEAQGEALGG